MKPSAMPRKAEGPPETEAWWDRSGVDALIAEAVAAERRRCVKLAKFRAAVAAHMIELINAGEIISQCPELAAAAENGARIEAEFIAELLAREPSAAAIRKGA